MTTQKYRGSQAMYLQLQKNEKKAIISLCRERARKTKRVRCNGEERKYGLLITSIVFCLVSYVAILIFHYFSWSLNLLKIKKKKNVKRSCALAFALVVFMQPVCIIILNFFFTSFRLRVSLFVFVPVFAFKMHN